MADEIQIANVLSDKNAMLVLTYMSYMNDRPKLSDLDNIITNFHILDAAVKSLVCAGLLKTDVITKPRKTTYLEYTEKGRLVSHLLQQVNEIYVHDIETAIPPRKVQII